jgi:hypothetical protein
VGQGFFAEIKDVHRATGGAELIGEVVDDVTRDGRFIEAAGDSQNVQSVLRHDARLAARRKKVEHTLEQRKCFSEGNESDRKIN